MTSETVTDILTHAPHVKCFAIASVDLARSASKDASRRLPRARRRQAARNTYNKWQRQVDAITEEARSTSYDEIIQRLQSLPLNAVRLTFDPESADSMIDAVGKEIFHGPLPGVGIWEQFVSDELVFVWLWNDH